MYVMEVRIVSWLNIWLLHGKLIEVAVEYLMKVDK